MFTGAGPGRAGCRSAARDVLGTVTTMTMTVTFGMRQYDRGCDLACGRWARRHCQAGSTGHGVPRAAGPRD